MNQVNHGFMLKCTIQSHCTYHRYQVMNHLIFQFIKNFHLNLTFSYLYSRKLFVTFSSKKDILEIKKFCKQLIKKQKKREFWELILEVETLVIIRTLKVRDQSSHTANGKSCFK